MTHSAVASTIATPLTPLIGRDNDLMRIIEIIRSGVRLVTVTGIGGIGKSRLGTQIALELEPDYEAGAMFVPLAHLRDATTIPTEIAKALGHVSSVVNVTTLESVLGSAHRLLVLDNLEHIPEAGDTVAEIVTALPHLTVLCTSQVPLDIAGEHVYSLQPMPVVTAETSVEALRANASIALFLWRAQAANAHLEVGDSDLPIVADICAMLDGIPLAIELAAARTTILPLPELRLRLEHRLDILAGGSKHAPGRLQTMRNAIQWSYGLLNPQEQRIFRYLGVYNGFLHIDAVAHTLIKLAITDSALDVIETFVNRNLLRQAPGGYQMLQTLREFAAEQLEAESESDDARLAHALYAVRLADDAANKVIGPEQAATFQRLGKDLANIQLASDWASTHDATLALRIFTGTWRFLETQGLAVAYTRLVEPLTAAVSDTSLLASTYCGLGYLHEGLRQLESAESYFTQAITCAEDPILIIQSTSGLGLVAMNRSRMDQARTYLQRAYDLATVHGYTNGQISALANIASIAVHTGNMDEAILAYRKSITLVESIGNNTSLMALLSNLAIALAHDGNPQEALQNATRAIAIADETNDVTNKMYAMSAAAGAHFATGSYAEAAQVYESLIQLSRSMGMTWFELDTLGHLANTHLKTGETAAALVCVTRILADTVSTELVRPVLNAAGVVATTVAAFGDKGTAAILFSNIFQLCEQFDVPIEGSWRALHDRPVGEVESPWNLDQLREEALDTAHRLSNHFPAERQPATTPEKITSTLSPREQEVLAMVAQGLTNAEIADAMFISLRTITTHMTNIFIKLDVKNRSSAVNVAREANLLTSA